MATTAKPGDSGEPATPPMPWTTGPAPRFIALFLSILFFDRLAPTTLQVGGLGASVCGAIVGAALAFALLFLVPALWGLRARGEFAVIAARTYGEAGARRFVNVLIGLVQIGWFAVAIDYACLLSMRALVMARLLPAGAADFASGNAMPGFVYQITAVLWIFPAVLLGPKLIQLVAAVMSVYVIFPATVLGGLMVYSLSGFDSQHPTPFFWDARLGWRAFGAMIQHVFSYAALAGCGAAGWGAVSRDEADVRLGGVVGVFVAPIVIAYVALVSIAGALGGHPGVMTDASYSIAVLKVGIGGRLGAALMMSFTLALLGPACYAPTGFVRAFQAAWPGSRWWAWSLFGGLAAWPLVASGYAGRLELMFGILGGVITPVIGAVAADFLRDRGRWSGPRAGWDISGLTAWLPGAIVALSPYLGMGDWKAPQPAALIGFAVACGFRFVTARR